MTISSSLVRLGAQAAGVVVPVALVVLVAVVLDRRGADPHPAPAGDRNAVAVAFGAEPLSPLPQAAKFDPDKVALGRRLFHETRLSHDDTISCASCHALDKAGIDRRAHAVGIGGAIGTVNTPTVFNAGFNFRQFWDGRADTLEEQAGGPVHNPKEMGSNWAEVLPKLKADPEYRSAFARLYRDGMTGANIQDAIAAFERTLVTPDSPFDRYLRGDKTALSDRQLRGYRLFKALGCASCHQGVNVGGNMYESLGIFGNFFADRGKDAAEDQGRFNVTGNATDRHRFKVPGLRNVARTGPYFHDGSVRDLSEAIRLMARYQLGVDLSAGDVELIEAFLGSLTGSFEGKPL